MPKTKLFVRTMDTDNSGIEWSDAEELEVNLPEQKPGESSADLVMRIAQAINIAQWEKISEETLAEDETPPGDLVRAAGDSSNGVAWFDDQGHQGATYYLFEWHNEWMS
jgi:hypothetical protein